MTQGLKTLSLTGQEILPYISDLAKLRIAIFKEYPYLYVGNLDYELNYLKTYTSCAESFMVVVLNNDQVIGASTAIPLKFETAECQKPFLNHNLKIETIFYLGESLLLQAYRGKGIYRQFFQERELAAKKHGCEITTFCAVERAINDPRKPANYAPLDSIWQKFGYAKHPEISTQYEWKEIGEQSPSKKPMIFWMKTL